MVQSRASPGTRARAAADRVPSAARVGAVTPVERWALRSDGRFVAAMALSGLIVTAALAGIVYVVAWTLDHA